MQWFIYNFIKNEKRYAVFIYIRSGDIFSGSHPHRDYVQPPFCFYRNVLDNYKYKITYIISENKNNPVIEKILDKYLFWTFISNNILEE